MLVQSWRFLTILISALSMSEAFCRLGQIPAKLTYDWPTYYTVQGIYGRSRSDGMVLEILAVIAAFALAFLVRGREPAFGLTVAGASCLMVAVVLWFTLVAPVSAEFARATADSAPADWTGLRAQWEYTHAGRAVLQIGALSLLVLSVLLETGTQVAQAGARMRGGRERAA